MKPEEKLRLFSALANVLWIFLLICVIALFLPSVPSWAVFLVGIFATVYEGRKNKLQLLIHALTGLAVAWLYVQSVPLLRGVLPASAAGLLPLLPALAVILLGCLYAPRAFGMVSFGYFTAALIESACLSRPLPLLAALLIGAPIQMGVSHLMEKTLKKRIPEGDSNGKQE